MRKVVEQPGVPHITEFEKKIIELNLTPDMYIGSEALRVWAAAHKNTRYVPESLLKAWGMAPDFAV
jgi:hypothetical protein